MAAKTFSIAACAISGEHYIRRAFKSHWEPCIFILAKWRNDCAEVVTLRIELNGVVLPTNIEFCKELIAHAFAQDICYD